MQKYMRIVTIVNKSLKTKTMELENKRQRSFHWKYNWLPTRKLKEDTSDSVNLLLDSLF